ncbi:ATP-dependent zinc protease [Colwellia sp. BRX10-1]|nr:ATP-dependent zinc protease [Colwellia sp. BRX8-9]MBA6363004.1 ATP-dependent zinc protease [Colwellia sp. BRX8-8]MBA6373152.1 ATP-dependent zinc protease [Colwellia sp. BRX8-4]MBA6381130.1 ATP-dependent zinc protease [Colwellia sp. BRX10-7]MBA6388776.1 ATP-dependent zinc protease [Colwellia sp. BRX10-2]MBA6403588.1 ATP-dependent zinc protease [Colwellia sp. BRX10-5]MBA6407214.1 ATP-dependent zinc protease [Colwellia sp. BRX10-1]
MDNMKEKILVGARETIDLPELELFEVATRIDTGAQTSSLHVDHISENKVTGMLDFEFHPDSHDVTKTIKCSAKIVDRKRIKSSNGEKERRYIINTLAVMGELTWTVRLSLTDRSSMNHLMLLGREAMKGEMLVDPEFSYLASVEKISPSVE